MREDVLNLIENSNKSLNSMEIMNRIKPVNTVKDYEELVIILDKLCQDGLIRLTNNNAYVKNELLYGVLDGHDKGNAHLLIKDGEDLFIRKNNMNGACDGDTVLVDYTNKEHTEGKVVRVLKRSLGKSLAEVVNNDGILSFKLLDELPYQVIIEDNDLNLVDGLIVHLDYIRDIRKGQVLARIDDVIGHKNAPGKDTDIAIVAREFGIKLNFSNEALEEASKMPRELTNEMILDGLKDGRVDFRNDIIFTIDGKDTKDIDDAVSLKMLSNGNYQLGVHIADVSHYVKKDSAIWKEAESRGNSNYLGNKVIPMLPVELSNGICSLNPNEDRFTLSSVMEIDHAGNVVNKKIVKGIIKSRKKMNYDAVQDILENKETEDTKGYDTLEYIASSGDDLSKIAFENNMTEEELKDYNKEINEVKEGTIVNIPVRNILKNMHILSNILHDFKVRRGQIEFESDEVKIVMDENDNVVDIKPRIQRDAERLIEDFMIAANESVATYVNDECLPFVYRIHEVPSTKSMEEYLRFLELLGIHYDGVLNLEEVTSKQCQNLLEFLRDKESFKILNKKLLRSMKKARYSTENVGHFGIASKCYTHFTSPIRRMSDLLVHTSLSEYLQNEHIEDKFINDWYNYLTYICDYISDCEKNSEKCEYAVDDMLKADYMTRFIGEEFEATIDSMFNSSFFVQTDKYIDGRVDVIAKDGGNISLLSEYQYNEKLFAFTKNGRAILRYGDKVLVKCIAADKLRREVDFALVRKL